MDYSKIPVRFMTEEEQEYFKRRARLDDNNNPPVVIDKDGNYIYDYEEEDIAKR